jgi:uncharacterized protein (TIGR02246 family)
MAPDAAALDEAAILASARPDIEAANEAWLPGLQHRDALAITAAYSNDGLFIAPDGTVTRGRDAITGMYQARFPRLTEIRGGGVVLDGLAVVSPRCVYEWGHAWLEMAENGTDVVRSGGPYLTVWQREADGHWRISRNLAL